MKSPSYSTLELMALAASREVRDGEVVFAGTGLPMLGAMLAQRRHAPSAVLVFEAGAVDPEMLHLPMSVGDSRTLVGAAQAAGLFEVFTYLLQGGRIDVGFLGGAQIDRYGNINSTAIGDYQRPAVRLSGSGGSADAAALAGRTILMARHEKRRFPERVDYRTSPGWLAGGDSRRAAGLGADNGPAAVVTTMGVIRFRPVTREPFLASFHPGLAPEEVQAETGFPLDLSEAQETVPPTAEDLDLLRRVVDPEGIFLER
jgi:glutaconate CoA-transferase subunit B